MPAVVPSQIVEFISTAVSCYIIADNNNGIALYPPACGALTALLRLIDQLPSALLPSDPETYAQFIGSQEAIRFAVSKAQNHHGNDAALWLFPDFDGEPSHVEIIRDALVGCPDEVPPRQSKELPFIQDPVFRGPPADRLEYDSFRSHPRGVEGGHCTGGFPR